jgi:hypothetical protein
MTGKPLFAGKNDIDMLGMILKMFNGSEQMPKELCQTFNQNNMFSAKQLPLPKPEDFEYDQTLEAKLEKI